MIIASSSVGSDSHPTKTIVEAYSICMTASSDRAVSGAATPLSASRSAT